MYKFIYFISLILLVTSCQRDNIDDIESATPNTSPNIVVISSVVGFVSDEDGEGVENVSVTFESLQTYTNEVGFFSFDDVAMSKNASYIQVEKEGYFRGSRKFSTDLEETVTVKIELLEKESVGSVSANTGGTLAVDESSVELPSGNYTDSNGNFYNGQVEVFAKWLDPTDPKTFEQMPGELTGVDTDGNINVLATYGMMGVELETESGDQLSLPEGQSATITMKVPTALLSSAPSTIPLWHFNESAGNWEEEGEAVLVGDEYIGEVEHFSFWNCDAPFPLVELSGYIEVNGFTYDNALLKITDLSSGFCAYGYTGERGFFAGKVPEGSELELSIIGPCGFPIDDVAIGAFFSDENIGTVEIEAEMETVSISGRVESCIDEYDVAFVIVKSQYFDYMIQVEDDETFFKEFPGCGIGSEVEIYAIDVTNSLVSEVTEIDFSGNIIDLVLQPCDEYFQETIIVDYEGIDWEIQSDSTLLSIAVELDSFDFGSHTEYYYNVFGLDWENFNDFTPVFLGEFTVSTIEESAQYRIGFATQGFEISGECDFEKSMQGGEEIISFYGEFLGDPLVLDTDEYPGGINEVIFEVAVIVD